MRVDRISWTVRMVVTLARRVLGGPGNPRGFLCAQKQAAASWAWCAKCRAHATTSDAFSKGDRLERQRFFLQDHTRWRDVRHQKKNPGPRSPDFLHKESCEEAVWLNNCYNRQPAWVDAQLEQIAPAAGLSADHGDTLVGDLGDKNRATPEVVRKLCKQGQVKGAVEALEGLVGTSHRIDKHLLYDVLKECMAKKDLGLGGQVHDLALKMGFQSDTFLCNHFIRMYAAHGKLREAMDVFSGVALPDTFMWSSIVSAHAKQPGQAEQAIELYQHMRAAGRTEPDNHVFVAALHACAAAGDLQFGKQLHSQIKQRGLDSDMFVGGCLVNMYAKCGSLTDARVVFDGLRDKNVVTWNTMISGYAKQEGMGQDALTLYSAMHMEGRTVPSAVTFVCLLQACANVGVAALEKGKELHSQIKQRGLESDVVVGGCLVNMYAKCGNLVNARTVFDGLREKAVVTWTALIAGYAQQDGMGQDALSLYSAMHDEGMAVPNAVTFVCLLQACANVGVSALGRGKQLHSRIREHGLESDVAVGSSLVNMYAKCKSLKDARIVFDRLGEKNVVTWTAIISGYAQLEGMSQEALRLYRAMRSKGMATPNAVTYISLLQACVNVGALEQGKELHSEIHEGGFESNVSIGTCLVKMYAECGRLEVSREVFDRLPTKSLEAWTALLKGYAEHGEGGMAIQCFEELLQQRIQPDEVAYVCLLTACSHAGLVDQGQQYFESMQRHGVRPDERHYTCMVDLFVRSGHLDRAEQMLRASDSAGNVVSWTALLSACMSYGNVDKGRRCFDHLVRLQPTAATAYGLNGWNA